MEIYNKFLIDYLTKDSVQIQKVQYTLVDGFEVLIGTPELLIYDNMQTEELQNTVENEACRNAILQVWQAPETEDVEYCISNLTNYSVNITTKRYITVNDTRLQFGAEEMGLYIKSDEDKQRLYNELPVAYAAAIIEVWNEV